MMQTIIRLCGQSPEQLLATATMDGVAGGGLGISGARLEAPIIQGEASPAEDGTNSATHELMRVCRVLLARRSQTLRGRARLTYTNAAYAL